jgi:hypothetical protein
MSPPKGSSPHSREDAVAKVCVAREVQETQAQWPPTIHPDPVISHRERAWLRHFQHSAWALASSEAFSSAHAPLLWLLQRWRGMM